MKKRKRAQLLALIRFIAVDQAVITVTGFAIEGLLTFGIMLTGIPNFSRSGIPDTSKDCQSQDDPKDDGDDSVFHFTSAPMLCGKDDRHLSVQDRRSQ